MKITKKDRALLAGIGETPSTLVFWAFRYFVGRMSIHTVVFAQNLALNWEHLDERTQLAICTQLESLFEADDKVREAKHYSVPILPLGNSENRQAWEKVRAAYKHSNEKN